MSASVDTLVAVAFKSRRAFTTLRRAITSDLAVADPFVLDLCRFAAEHVDDYGEIPRKGDVGLWIDSEPEERRAALRESWRRISRQDVSEFTEDNLADRAVEILRTAAASTAAKRIGRMTVGDGDPTDTILTLAEEIKRIRPVRLDGLANLADYDVYLRPGREEGRRVATGIEKLDRFLGGGLMQELVFLMAGTGGGKTTFLVNRLVAAALRGAHCLHVTLELATVKTLHRYYRRIADADRGEFFEDPDAVEGRVSHWLRFASGSVHVLYLPAYTPTVADVKATVEIFADAHGELDVLALDYLDLLSREGMGRRLRTDEHLGMMSHEIRTICTTMDAEVITASQSNRQGLDADRLSLKHMAGAIAKAQAADVVLGLVQDDEERQMRQGRLGLLKMRDYPAGYEIPVHFDMDRMLILDLDHPDARARRAQMEEEWRQQTTE